MRHTSRPGIEKPRVPHDGGAGDDVEVEGCVVEKALVELELLPFVDVVADGGRERLVEEEIFSEDPVVAVAEIDAVIPVIDIGYFQRVVEDVVALLVVKEVGGEVAVVEVQFLPGVAEPQNPASRTAELLSRLGIGGGVGEFPVVEYIVDIEILQIGVHSGKAQVVYPLAFRGVEARDTFQTVVVDAFLVVVIHTDER